MIFAAAPSLLRGRRERFRYTFVSFVPLDEISDEASVPELKGPAA
jgi:hypothetical protein